MMKIFGQLMSIATLLFLGIVVALGWVLYEVALKSSADADPISFSVEAGEGVQDIATRLKDESIIGNVFLFETYMSTFDLDTRVQVGIYELRPGSNISSVARALTEVLVNEVQITIPEGFTLVQIGEVLEQDLAIPAAEWMAMVGVDSPLAEAYEVLQDKPDDVDLEGYLFPDTYRFEEGATAEQVARRMVETLERRLTENENDLSGIENYHDLITLASIVEREVRTEPDRPVVAGIFQNRLDIGMALQADSTVNYVTGKDTPGISLEDTELESPYNTYKYPGLPPGPISNPGMVSIIAAANPADTDYFFFLTTEEGEVKYAVTHDQHVQNKALYL